MECHAREGQALPQDLGRRDERRRPPLRGRLHRPREAQERLKERPARKEGGLYILKEDWKEEQVKSDDYGKIRDEGEKPGRDKEDGPGGIRQDHTLEAQARHKEGLHGKGEEAAREDKEGPREVPQAA